MIEPAAGLTRSLMTFLVEAYAEDEAPNTKGGVDKRTVLRLDPRLAPVKVAVLPLSRNEALSPKARDLAAELRRYWNVDFDDAQAIGRRYRRQDEIGTPVLRHRRLRHPRRRRRHRTGARHDEPGADPHRQGHASTWRRASSVAELVTHLRAGVRTSSADLPSALASSGSRQTRHGRHSMSEPQRSQVDRRAPRALSRRPRALSLSKGQWRLSAHRPHRGRRARRAGADGGDHQRRVPAVVPGAGGGRGAGRRPRGPAGLVRLRDDHQPGDRRGRSARRCRCCSSIRASGFGRCSCTGSIR